MPIHQFYKRAGASAFFSSLRNLRNLWTSLVMIVLGITLCQGQARSMTSAQPQGTIQTITVQFEGVDRDVSIYIPSGYQTGRPAPVVFALHGGGGDASRMYDPDKRITEYAEAERFIAVFPNGLPRAGFPPGNYYWGDSVNIPYMDHLIDLMMSHYTIDRRRVYFIGFSGGAHLVYNLAADPAISARIAAVATVAGEWGSKMVEPPTAPWEIIDPIASGAVPMSALLLQGGRDVGMPEKGGFDEEMERIVTSFQVKVDTWRLFIRAGAGSELSLSGVPSRVLATQFTNASTGQIIVSVVDSKLAHAWPDWNFMGVIWEFFERAPSR